MRGLAITTGVGLLLAAAPGFASAADLLGPLPGGAMSRTLVGPSDELIGYLAFDPKLLQGPLPEGVRLRTLGEGAAKRAELAAYLKAHPERAGWAMSYYEILLVHAGRYDKLRPGHSWGMMVWYPYLARTDTADPRPRGDNLYAIGSWVSDRRLAAYMRARGFPAADGRVSLSWSRTRAAGRFQAPGITVEGGCRLRGRPRIPRWGKTGFSYQTMWTPKALGPTFELTTWGGHRELDCVDARWRVTGSHPFARAFNDPALGDPALYPTEFAYGYMLASGLYRR